MGRQIASVVADRHCDHGVDLRLGGQVAEITARTARPPASDWYRPVRPGHGVRRLRRTR
ncbi:hypothetical protein ACH4NT_14755 [Streptomyces lydicus]|uniref:hypothetical protein n=1 Tax=Streptomyces lydicus TaxID=47763 RepID=UPI0037B79BE7